VIFMCGRSSTIDGVDEAWLNVFLRKQRAFNIFPVTQAALLQHSIKRAADQIHCIM